MRSNQGLHLPLGDMLQLCTDGSIDVVEDTEIELVARGPDLQSAAQVLVDLPCSRNGKDNITLLMMLIPWRDLLIQLDALVRSGIPVEQIMAGTMSFDHAGVAKSLFDKGINSIEMSGDPGMFLPKAYFLDAIEPLAALKAEGLSCTVHLPLWSVEPSTPLTTVRKVSTAHSRSSWALATDIVPQAKAARTLGIANFAICIGSGVVLLLRGVLIDPINWLLGSSSSGYLSLHSLATLRVLASALVIIPLPNKKQA